MRPDGLVVVGGRVAENDIVHLVDVDVTGLFVLPGLIDMHVHLVPDIDATRVATESGLAAVIDRLSTALAGGVTTVRDVGGDLLTLLAARRAQAEGAVLGSRLLMAWPALTVPRGHGTHSGHGLAIDSERRCQRRRHPR